MYKNIPFLIFLTLILFVSVQFLRTRHYISIGKNLVEAAEPFEQSPTSPSARILVLGDSSAVGVGASTSTLSVAGRIGTAYPNVHITNMGVSGAKTHEVLKTLKEISEPYDLIILHTGGNDIVRHTPLRDVAKNLSELLELAEATATHVIVLHGGNIGTSKLFPWGTRWILRKRTAAVRTIFLEETKDRKTHYIDLWKEQVDDPFYQDPQTYYARDLFHPGDEGYRVWFHAMRPFLDAWLVP